MTNVSAAIERRLILLLGSPRSGTTWLANILNSHRGVAYSHEPLSKLPLPALRDVIERVKDEGVLQSAERQALIAEWCQAYHISRRPPFFAKDYLRVPPSLIWLAWLNVRACHLGHGVFRRLFSPSPRARFDLLIKEIDWPKQAQRIVKALDPELILIFRHPCAVIASQIQGNRLGLLFREERASWLEHFGKACEDLGFSRSAIEKMEGHEWLALYWLMTNRTYQTILRAHPRSHAVVYEDLCRDPHGASRRVFQFLGWPMGRQTLRFLEKSTQGSRSSLATMLLGQHPYFSIYRDSRESMESYKNTLSEAQQERILSLIKPHFPYDAYWPSANGEVCAAAGQTARVAVP
jgi:hypothetical protein